MEAFEPPRPRPPTTAGPDPASPGRVPAGGPRRAGNRTNVLLLQAKLRVGAVDDPLEREADRVAREVARGRPATTLDATPAPAARRSPAGPSSGPAGGDLDADTTAAVDRARGGGRPLDEAVRRSMEDGFGADFGAVRIHADGPADTLSRALQAQAFTTGNDIFFSRGAFQPTSASGRELLAHELTHTVQQGAVPADGPVRRVFAGIEYTEAGPNHLDNYAGPGPAGVARVHQAVIRGTQFSFFPIADLTAAFGPPRDNDFEVLRTGRVRLTNDVESSEWIVEGHEGPDLAPADKLAEMAADITELYAARAELAAAVTTAEGLAGVEDVVLVAGDVADLSALPADPGVFEYRLGAAQGTVQFTVQYTNKDTIRRINELNMSKYLTGSKIGVGDDAKQVTGNPGAIQSLNDRLGRSSFGKAHNVVLAGLTAGSRAVAGDDGAQLLTAADVGVIKLMVLNDAMAVVLTRYAGGVGQADQKNIQRFFPKARRQEYVHAMAEAQVPQPALDRLRTQLRVATAAMARLVFDNIDTAALPVNSTLDELHPDHDVDEPAEVGELRDIAFRLTGGRAVTPAETLRLKTAVLGPAGGHLDTAAHDATDAYTDGTGAATPDNVVTSIGFARPSGDPDEPGPPIGAVYEFRDREVAMTGADQTAVLATLRTLLEGA